MPLFMSTATNKVDGKGRVSVPASFRANLLKGGFTEVVIYASIRGSFLEGSDEVFVESILDRMSEEFDFQSDDLEGMALAFMGETYTLSFDPEGRVLLPRALMDSAGISGQATFVGLGDTFQVWEPQAFEVRRKDLLQKARKNLGRLGSVGRVGRGRTRRDT